MIANEFSRWQEDYNAKIRRWVPFYEQLLDQTASLPPGFQAIDILDLGSGVGNAVAPVVERFPEAHFYLVDASPDMMDALRKRFTDMGDFMFIEKNFQELSILAHSFDLVLACLSLHHLDAEGKRQIFAEIHRWLRPGGMFICSDLFGNKQDTDYQEKVLQPWEAYARSRGTTHEEWDQMMEHHARFDFPDRVEDQMEWLRQAGFAQVTSQMLDRNFGTIYAYKALQA